ncbi:MAG: ABC transporter permease [Clostridia bacterium]|nr:ABC transporter permease [Clostridia bacterium]MBR0408330.1 ABC transporter permease [Clostridia bacterium]
MMLGECFSMSLSNILNNRVRSFLTVLGILIGVTAVIALITTVSGFSGTLSSSFMSMGAGTLSVTVTGSDLKPGMTTEDLEELTELDIVEGITPNVTLRSRLSKSGKYKTNVSISGKNFFYFTKTADAVERGRTIHPTDENSRTFVCLINHDIMEELFYGIDPVGETMYIDGVPFLVIGVLAESEGASVINLLSGTASVIIPYTTALKMNNANVVTSFTVYLAEGADSTQASETITETMDRMFSFEEDCFTVTTMSGIEDTMNSMLSMVSTLLAGIASIALVVGGIGIMNMMLTTVTERTMEIGLKKALGAIPWQIQLQFLMESFLLSMIGGLLGVALGLGLSFSLCQATGMTFVISPGAILLGVGFSAAVGIIFGWAPARKASKLNPIDALRAM